MVDDEVDQLIALIVAVIVPVFGLVSALVPDDKMPGWCSKAINFIAFNWGAAKNEKIPKE